MKLFVAISCLLALSAVAKAGAPLGLDEYGVNGGLGGLNGLEGLVYAPGHASADYYAYPSYAFEYAVKDAHTGDNKAQWEKRDGDVVKGAYSLVEPDGSLRVVEYWADDKSGFNAVVKRVGPNIHPATVKEAPIYKAPIPVLGQELGLGPISVGSVAKYGGLLANAPLITGPINGGALSSVNLYKENIPVVKPVAPIIPAPVFKALPAPIYNAGPIVGAPLLKEPLGYGGPIGLIKEPISYGGPVGIKEPIGYGGPIGINKESFGYGNIGLIKEPIAYGGIKEPITSLGLLNGWKAPLIKEPLPLIKEPIALGYGLGEGLLKGPAYDGYGYGGLLGKGDLGGWNGWGAGGLGYKH